MFKKILLLLSAILLCSCTNNGLTKTSEALYNIDDVSFTMSEHNFIMDNHNETYLIGFDYEVGNALTKINDSVILRPCESYTITLDVNPSLYGTSDYTYYEFDYTVDYDVVYTSDYVLVFINEDNFDLVKEILDNEIKLAKVVNRYNHTYRFSYDYYAYYNEENSCYDVYYKTTYIKSLAL